MEIVLAWVTDGERKNECWVIDNGSHRAYPAEVPLGHSLDDHIGSIAEGKEVVSARDSKGRMWTINLKTRKANLGISGGDDLPSSLLSESCPQHKYAKLVYSDDSQLELIFDVGQFVYCPDIACNFVSPRNWQGRMVTMLFGKDMLLLQFEIFRRKYIAQCAGNGK